MYIVIWIYDTFENDVGINHELGFDLKETSLKSVLFGRYTHECVEICCLEFIVWKQFATK